MTVKYLGVIVDIAGKADRKNLTFGRIRIEKRNVVIYESFDDIPKELIESLTPNQYAEFQKTFEEGGGFLQRESEVAYDGGILN